MRVCGLWREQTHPWIHLPVQGNRGQRHIRSTRPTPVSPLQVPYTQTALQTQLKTQTRPPLCCHLQSHPSPQQKLGPGSQVPPLAQCPHLPPRSSLVRSCAGGRADRPPHGSLPQGTRELTQAPGPGCVPPAHSPQHWEPNQAKAESQKTLNT